MAYFWFLSGNLQQAANKYEKCLQIYDQYHPARLNLASLHHQYGQLKDALFYYEILLQHRNFTERYAEEHASGELQYNAIKKL